MISANPCSISAQTDTPMFGLSLLCSQSKQLPLHFIEEAQHSDVLFDRATDDCRNSQPSSFLQFSDVLQVPPIQPDTKNLPNTVHLGSSASSVGPSPTAVYSTRYPNGIAAVSENAPGPLESAKEITASLGTFNYPLGARAALPPAALEELTKKYQPLIDRVMARLSEAERHEVNLHYQSDYRQAWITVSYAQRMSDAFVQASYAIYGKHPDKIWPSIVADRKARLGDEYYEWYNSADLLRPDVPRIPPTATADTHAATRDALPTGVPAPTPERKIV